MAVWGAVPACRSRDEAERHGTRHMVAVATAYQFRREVLEADRPVVVDFYATWCAPCKMLSPMLDRLAGEYKGRAKFVQVDVDQSPALARQHGVRAYPTVLLFVGGRERRRWRGARDRGVYRDAIEQAIRTQSESKGSRDGPDRRDGDVPGPAVDAAGRGAWDR